MTFYKHTTGPAGAGKSSFVQTLLTLLSCDVHPKTNQCKVGGGAMHCTTALRSFKLERINARLWDTWGLTEETYRGMEVVSVDHIALLIRSLSAPLSVYMYHSFLALSTARFLTTGACTGPSAAKPRST